MSQRDMPREGSSNMNPNYQNNLVHLNQQYVQPTSSSAHQPFQNASGTDNQLRNNRYQRGSNFRNKPVVDISRSNLQPTAQEFHPSSSSNGAVRKNSYYSKGNGKNHQNRSNNESRSTFDDSYQNQGSSNEYIREENYGGIDREHGASDRDHKDGRKRENNSYNRGYNSSRYNYNNGKSDNGESRKTYGKNDYQNHKENNKSDKKNYKNKDSNGEKEVRQKYYENSGEKPQQLKKKIDSASQRERLEQMVTHRMLECLVCCEKLKNTDKVWSCKQCFHILHLTCITRWAKSSKLESGWRCPACQNVLNDIPKEYRCYCDKVFEPQFEPGQMPHSCGETCMRKGKNCEHTCTLLCHPGPCPECNIMVKRPCGCGATAPTVKCSSDLLTLCTNICNKELNCTKHKCTKTCHAGDCDECKEKIVQECYCGKEGRKVNCDKDVVNEGISSYNCENECMKVLNCGNHKCEQLCHPGDCEGCPLNPKLVSTCPCGQTELKDERKSCLDPIPCCDKVCNKKLSCGQPSDPHLCQSKCHLGPCPRCPLSTMVRCRCGHMDKEVLCKDLLTKADDARCQKKCTKKRLCSKHKCNQFCCIEDEHYCPLPCNHMLSCGIHRCDLYCHRGRCAPCYQSSFEELYCECGASVLYPPVPCGTRPPACNNPCSRPPECGHEPHHTCHTGPCPPCMFFTTKRCHGGHEERRTIPCHQQNFSCGLRCNKPMPCGRHKCDQVCHAGACATPCKQACTIQRRSCEHACNQPCHDPPCPKSSCRQTVVVSCQCGLKTGTRICCELAEEFKKMSLLQWASKLADVREGDTLDIASLESRMKKGGSHKVMECTEECRLIERNRRLAIGLQIRNPDLTTTKLTPRFTEFMKDCAKKNPKFCQHVHDKLTDLVHLAKQSKQKSRSHSFECMNREKRQFVHEYCEHFGCESVAYDREPNRNIVATAFKDKSWLPSCSVLEFLNRENGLRKVPGPISGAILNASGPSAHPSVYMKLPSAPKASYQMQEAPKSPPLQPESKYIDYFNYPPL